MNSVNGMTRDGTAHARRGHQQPNRENCAAQAAGDKPSRWANHSLCLIEHSALNMIRQHAEGALGCGGGRARRCCATYLSGSKILQHFCGILRTLTPRSRVRLRCRRTSLSAGLSRRQNNLYPGNSADCDATQTAGISKSGGHMTRGKYRISRQHLGGDVTARGRRGERTFGTGGLARWGATVWRCA